MLKVAIGHSEMVDVEDIMEEIIEQAEEGLGGAEPKAAVVFAAVDLEYADILNALQAQWPGLQVVGCTTDGESSSQLGFVDDSITIGFFASDDIDISVGVGRDTSSDIRKAAEAAYADARAATDKTPGMCIVTPTSLTASNEQIVNAVRDVVGSDIPLFGASSGDQWRFQKTYQFFNDEVLEDAIPLILFSGPIRVASGTQSGWKTIGPVGTVTQVEGNVIHKIDDGSALDFYKNLLGPDATPSGDRPLAILDAAGNISRLRASNEMFDPETGAVTFFGEFSEGDQVQVTVANRGDILDGTRASVQRAIGGFADGGTPEAAMFFSCSARKLLLGTRTGEEYEILKQVVGADIPVVGFYGYGEIGPALTGDASCEFHNETFVTVLLGSAE
jgi:hypothetical protein